MKVGRSQCDNPPEKATFKKSSVIRLKIVKFNVKFTAHYEQTLLGITQVESSDKQ